VTPDPQKILEYHKHLIWPVIQKYLDYPPYPSAFALPAKYAADLDYVRSSITEYPRRQGKYLRPTLLCLACQGMTGNSAVAKLASAAMQVSEEWILIHDDFEDDSQMRRGLPALHRQFSPEIAVNAGDNLQAVMWKIIFDVTQKLPRPQSIKFFNEFYAIIHRTTIGQGVEIKWFRDNKTDFSDEDWFFLADSKTCYYTIAGPLRLGAIIAGASPFQITVLTQFGIKLGRCFQLVDDLLDLTSDFAGQKSQAGNDIYEGKRTLILGHLLRTASEPDKKKLLHLLALPKPQKTPDGISWIIEKMHSYGSIRYARDLAENFKNEALDILTRINFFHDPQALSDLKTLTEFILTRDH